MEKEDKRNEENDGNGGNGSNVGNDSSHRLQVLPAHKRGLRARSRKARKQQIRGTGRK